MTRRGNHMRTVFFILFSFSFALAFSQGKWKIAYVHWKDTLVAENWINTMDMKGGNIQTIIDYPGSNWMPMATRNKIWFQVEKDTAGMRKGLYIYDLKRKEEKFLFDAKGLYQDIDYDKRSKLYAGGFSHKPGNAARSQYDIFLFNEDGTGKVQVTNDTAIDLEPVFSPDRKKIIFRSNRDRNPASWAEFEIYSINTDGTGLKRLTFNPDTTRNVLRSSSPVIAPDGRIVFSGYWDGTYRLMVMNRDGSDIKPLFGMDDMEQVSCHFSPNGKQIVFTGRKKGARNFDIYLVNTNGTELRQLTNDWRRKVQPFFIKLK
jgi:WD40 repeat protein